MNANFLEVLGSLSRAGVERILVPFSGSGDEGQINDIMFEPDVKVQKTHERTLMEFFMEMFEEDSRICVDNDGCEGQYTLDLSKLELHVHIAEPVMTTVVDEFEPLDLSEHEFMQVAHSEPTAP